MIRYALNKMLLAFKRRYNYDVGYQQDILRADLGAFLKFMGLQTMSAHAGKLPMGPLYAARVRAIIWDDCGPCTQLVVNMALEAGLDPALVRALIDRDLQHLPAELALVVRFTEQVLAHNPEADELREQIRALWGDKGLIAIGFAISSYRVYPALKYALGYGKACSRIQVNESFLTPTRESALAEEARGV